MPEASQAEGLGEADLKVSPVARPARLALVDDTGSVAEAGRGAARHTRTWSVGAPAVVAGCRRLRFGPAASWVSAVGRPAVRDDQCWAVSGPSEVRRGYSTATFSDRPPAVASSETAGQGLPVNRVSPEG
jgi:hypothetical protein